MTPVYNLREHAIDVDNSGKSLHDHSVDCSSIFSHSLLWL